VTDLRKETPTTQLTNRRRVGIAAAAIMLTVCVCAWLSGPAFARPSAAQRTIRCPLPHGEEGGVALAYFATKVSCPRAKPVAVKARFLPERCHLTAAAGCRTTGFMCRHSHPQMPGQTQPGDIIRWTQGRKAIKFEEPG
jgi:hypothetical protein